MSRENQDDGNNIFVKDGRPMRFFFHSSVKEGIGRITAIIRKHGGEVVRVDRHTDVVLVDEEADIGLISRRYWSNPDRNKLKIQVEPRGFVKRCVRNGVCEHKKPIVQGMPGRPGRRRDGTGRVNFTPEDDERLAYYMATIFPDAESGGRMGNKYYQELERLAENPEFEWAGRHTWHSWRERYKNNRAVFDENIARIAAELLPYRSERGGDNRSRQYKALRNRRIEEEEEEEGEDEEEAVEEEEEVKKVEEERWEEGEESEEERGAEKNKNWEPPVHKNKNVSSARRNKGNDRMTPSKTHGTTGKQKRSRASATLHSRSSSPPVNAKRARAISRQQDKETSPEMEMEMEIQDDDLFGDYALGMQDAEERSSPRPVSPPILIIDSDDGPEMTQRTLVGTPTPMSRPSHARAHTSASRKRNTMEGSPSSGETVHTVREAVPSTAVASAPTNDPTAASANNADQASKRGKSRRERPDMEREVSSRAHYAEDAPFRNTRARSRSVEPQPITKVSARDIARDKSRKASTKGGESRRKRGELGGIPEAEDQDDVNEGTEPVPSAELELDMQLDPELAPRPGQLSTNKHATLVIREMHEDERVVEDLLEDGASGVSSGLFSGDDENVLPTFQDIEVDMEEESLDGDDQETHQVLREAAMAQAGRRSEERRQVDVGVEENSSVLEEEGEDAVKELRAKMSSTRLARAPRPNTRMQTRSGVIGTGNAQEPTARARSRRG